MIFKKPLINGFVIIIIGVIIYAGTYSFVRRTVGYPQNSREAVIDFSTNEQQEVETVNVSGEFFYRGKRDGGYYTLFWMSTPRVHSDDVIRLGSDGSFKSQFPKNSRELSLLGGYSEDPDIYAPSLASIEVPIDIRNSDINLGRVELKEHEELQKYMDNYIGETVELSGEIVMEDYIFGVFDIIIASRNSWKGMSVSPEPDIDYVGPIREPGSFSTDLPADFGEVFIMVTYFPVDGEDQIKLRAGNMPGVLRSTYENNPLVVGREDISGLQIVFD